MFLLKNNFIFIIFFVPCLYGLISSVVAILSKRLLNSSKDKNDMSTIIVPAINFLPNLIFFYFVGIIFKYCQDSSNSTDTYSFLYNCVNWESPIIDELLYFAFILGFILFHLRHYLFLAKNTKNHKADIVICISSFVIAISTCAFSPISIYVIFITNYIFTSLLSRILTKIEHKARDGVLYQK